MLVDVDVPWFPADVQPNEQSFWAHIDVDVLKAGSPMWTFPGDLRLQGDSGRILEQLLAELRAKATPRFAAAAARRLERLKAARAERACPRRPARGGPGPARRHQSALSDGGARQGARRRGHHLQRGGAQHAGGADADSAPAAEHDGGDRRRRPRLVRRHGARRQARGAGPADGAGGRRRQLLFRRPVLGVRGRAAIRTADFFPSCSTIPAGRR